MIQIFFSVSVKKLNNLKYCEFNDYKKRYRKTSTNICPPLETFFVMTQVQLEKLQSEISSIARKTGISSATQLAKLVPKGQKADKAGLEKILKTGFFL